MRGWASPGRLGGPEPEIRSPACSPITSARKHHLHRYAASPGYLDWANQPDPFRTFAGAPAVDLPLLADALATPYGDLYVPGAVAPRPLDRDAVAVLFELALGLSAWKEYRGSRWALRCNPSSGNLHPTEGYAVLPALPGLEAGVYHYVSRDHRLERRCTLAARRAGSPERCPPGRSSSACPRSTGARRGSTASGPSATASTTPGHALAAVRYAAAALGWSAVLLDHLGDDDLAALARPRPRRRTSPGWTRPTANTPTRPSWSSARRRPAATWTRPCRPRHSATGPGPAGRTR